MNLFSPRSLVRRFRWLLLQTAILFGLPAGVFAQAVKKEPRELLPPPFDRYLSARVAEISGVDWQKEITPQTWPRVQATMRKQLQGMLGLDPWPERGALHAAILGTVQGEGYVVEKLHFQSLPGVYVTANLYRPNEVRERLPAILYVCGHANVMENGVSMGNKADYQHHGIWFARHGYVCIILDTIQLGEIRGFHHGTYNLKRWWWPARGYTPAGVEAWNGIRALDYLETRAEVDAARIGITGRSGGGAYSWWIGALDDRIRVAVPVAGITSLHNHVIDGAIEGHCDCMFVVNTERWDYDRIAALLAPRPLLISNTDKDEIFPLDGVVQVYDRARALYKLLGKEANIGLHIAEGPHKDTQPLNVAAFEWMNRFLKGNERGTFIDEPARKLHPPRELKVFPELPSDEKVTTVDEFFVPAYSATPPVSTLSEWVAQRDRWLQTLRDQSFRAWPANRSAPTLKKISESNRDGIRTTLYTFESESPFQLELQVRARQDLKADALRSIVLRVLGEDDRLADNASRADRFSAEDRALLMRGETAIAYFHPRGVGPKGGWDGLSERKQTQLRRRLHLIGESLEGGQTWDILQAAAAVRGASGFAEKPLSLHASKQMAVNALYASLFISKIENLELRDLPASHAVAPAYLNVHRHLDLPQAVALAAERAHVRLPGSEPGPWSYAVKMAELFEPGGARLQFSTGAAE